jgi:hypothetical protein
MAYTDIDFPAEYFNTVIWTGDGTSPRNITGVGFQPDMVWQKSRSLAYTHSISDVVRGANKRLQSNDSDAEQTDFAYGYTSAFISDGFTAISGATSIENFNQSSATYVAWNWLANGAGVSNTAGSISSTVSANTTSGFSIVSYTGNRTPTADQSIGHGLGAVPSMMIVKNRSNGSRGWRVYHKSLGTPDKELILNSYAAVGTDTATWGNTTPTSSVFYVGASGETNTAGENYIAYCFADVKGYSKFGSYTGNGSTDGTFVYTGFKTAFVMMKNASQSGKWLMMDSKRPTAAPGNPNNARLFADQSSAENTASNMIDLLSNGFKLRTSDTDHNASGDINIYMAFAENPFVSSTSIPTTAR